ncbi:MAG: NAD-dependent epimerase/dehydratase family protein [Deltaproteobacteria bacterium]|nr:NAD-dependent epimerase/dehydratase family protein [Deltaproteobacteria bacterium]
MNVLVTGGAGFLGHHLVAHWRRARTGDRLLVLDALTYAADASRLGDTPLHVGDVADPLAVRAAFERLGAVDLVVHMAAETHVDRSIAAPAAFVRSNVVGTQVLLDVARERGAGRFLHVSTDEVYGSIAEGFADESAPFRPGSPYAASKAGAEHLVAAAGHTHGLDVVLLRPANGFGRGQFPEKLLPVLCRAAARGEPLPLYGDGLHCRDWVASEDVARACMLVATRGSAGTAYNLPGEGPRTNRSVAEAICRLSGRGDDAIISVPDRPGHDRRYAMDGSRLARLGYSPTITLASALPGLLEEARRA